MIATLLLQAPLQAQDLAYFIGLAESNNPQLEAMRLRTDLAEEKVEEAGALPDTEFGIGVFIPEMQTRTGAQEARFSVS